MDPIADFLIKVKNAGLAGRESVVVPHSEIKEAIADLLVKNGFLKSIAKKRKNNHKILEAEVEYAEGKIPRINDVARVSKPSKRVYQGVKEIKSFKNGLGLIVLSTPKGILTDKEAKKEKVGGEVLFKVW